jgi:hypothetical protein
MIYTCRNIDGTPFAVALAATINPVAESVQFDFHEEKGDGFGTKYSPKNSIMQIFPPYRILTSFPCCCR